MAYAVEYAVSNQVHIRESSRPNMTMKELRAVRSSRLNKDIRILQADSGKCTVVLDTSEYKDKLYTLLESSVYEPLPKDSTAKVERKVQALFPNTKLLFLLI
jgi:hypothetical protein